MHTLRFPGIAAPRTRSSRLVVAVLRQRGGEAWMVTYSVPFFRRLADERVLAGVVQPRTWI
jgi:hypothetical protein